MAKIDIENYINQRLLQSNNDDKGQKFGMAKVDHNYIKS